MSKRMNEIDEAEHFSSGKLEGNDLNNDGGRRREAIVKKASLLGEKQSAFDFDPVKAFRLSPLTLIKSIVKFCFGYLLAIVHGSLAPGSAWDKYSVIGARMFNGSCMSTLIDCFVLGIVGGSLAGTKVSGPDKAVVVFFFGCVAMLPFSGHFLFVLAMLIIIILIGIVDALWYVIQALACWPCHECHCSCCDLLSCCAIPCIASPDDD